MFTFGHGRLDRDALAGLLTGAGVGLVVDVRRHPGSRANAAASRDTLPGLVAQVGADYRWEPDLGGRRHLTAEQVEASPDTWWRVPSFRAYAGWTRSAPFRAALTGLLEGPEDTALMCAEAVWWRCHRRLISDVLVLEAGRVVRHLMHDGRLVSHVPSAGARLGTDGRVVWDG